MKSDDGFKIYGAGMSSSFTESQFSVLSPSPNRIKFDLERIMQTDYHIDDLQHVYFVISSFDELLEATQSDFKPLYARLEEHEEQYNTLDILPTDIVYTQGTQDYMKSRLKA